MLDRRGSDDLRGGERITSRPPRGAHTPGAAPGRRKRIGGELKSARAGITAGGGSNGGDLEPVAAAGAKLTAPNGSGGDQSGVDIAGSGDKCRMRGLMRCTNGAAGPAAGRYREIPEGEDRGGGIKTRQRANAEAVFARGGR